MGKEKHKDDRRVRLQRREDDEIRIMTERAISNWLKFTGILLTLLVIIGAYSVWIKKGDADVAIEVSKKTDRIDKNISKIVTEMTANRMIIRDLKNDTNNLKNGVKGNRQEIVSIKGEVKSLQRSVYKRELLEAREKN